MGLDHGLLNMKNRTKNIDNEIDKYKKDQRKAETSENRCQSAQHKINKAKAKELSDLWLVQIIEKHGANFGKKELTKQLDSMMKWEPLKFIMFVEKFISEVSK